MPAPRDALSAFEKADEIDFFPAYNSKRRFRGRAAGCVVIVLVFCAIAGAFAGIHRKNEAGAASPTGGASSEEHREPERFFPFGPSTLRALEGKPEAVTRVAVTRHRKAPSDDEDGHPALSPAALATIMEESPRSTGGGRELLGVASADGKRRISFVRFDLSDFSREDTILGAKLILHLTGKRLDRETIVRLDCTDEDDRWEEGTIGWDSRLNQDAEWMHVASIEAKKPGQWLSIDVKEAIRADKDSVTFRLTTEEEERLTFASREWEGGGADPTLKVLVQRRGAPARVRPHFLPHEG